jgi:hypothetical protein
MEISPKQKPRFRIIVKDLHTRKNKIFTIYNGKTLLEDFIIKLKTKVEEIK